MSIKKGSDTAEEAIRTGVKKFKKSIDRMKEPKKWTEDLDHQMQDKHL